MNEAAIKRHKYSWIIRIFLFSLLCGFLCVIPHFLINELPYHRSVKEKINLANVDFIQGEYANVINLYLPILNRYPRYKDGRIKCVQACFALSKENEDYYWIGLSLLKDQKCNKQETKQMRLFLPEVYKKDFASHFVRA